MNKDFYSHYAKSKETIRITVDKNNNGLSGESLRAIFYLERLTNLKSRAEIGDISYYNSRKDYRKDMRQWDNWYKDNKCIITAQQSANVIDSVIRSTRWMDQKAIE